MTSETTQRTEAFDAVIAGAGIGALTLACYLAPLGFRILILDKRPALSPVHRGELVQPLGLGILSELSLIDELLSSPHTLYRSFDFLDGNGRLLMRSHYDRGQSSHPFALAIEPHQMDQILARSLSSYPNILLRFGTELTQISVDRQGVEVTARQSDGTPTRILARVIVGDDGRHSRVREISGLAQDNGPIAPYKDSYLGGSLLLPEGEKISSALLDTTGRYFLGPRFIFFFFSVSERRRFFLLLVPDSDREKFFAGGTAPLLARLDSLVPGFSRMAKAQGYDDPTRYVPLPVWKVDLKQWVRDGVVLMGDAAHAMNPHVAQGRNQAMEDGRVLAPILAKALLGGPLTTREQLLEYESRRRPVIRALHTLADEMTFIWNSGHPLVVAAREASFRGIGRIPSLEEKIVTTIGGEKIRPLSPLDKLRALSSGLFRTP
ncbi:MAG: FAD-dependent oxidoreductase [Leptospirillia bacterium]